MEQQERRLSPQAVGLNEHPGVKNTSGTPTKMSKKATFLIALVMGIVLFVGGGLLTLYGFYNVSDSAGVYDEARSLNQNDYNAGRINQEQLDQAQRGVNYDQSQYGQYTAENPTAGYAGILLLVIGIAIGITGTIGLVKNSNPRRHRVFPNYAVGGGQIAPSVLAWSSSSDFLSSLS